MLIIIVAHAINISYFYIFYLKQKKKKHTFNWWGGGQHFIHTVDIKIISQISSFNIHILKVANSVMSSI